MEEFRWKPPEPASPEDIKRGRSYWMRMRRSQTGEDVPEVFSREFDSLLANTKISEMVILSDGTVAFETEPVHWINAYVGYLLGTYTCIIVPHRIEVVRERGVFGYVTDGFAISCSESGRYDGNLAHLYTQNAQAGFPGGFCFGSRNDYVKYLLYYKEIFTLVTIVLDSLWHVNPADLPKLKNQYLKVRADGSIVERSKPALQTVTSLLSQVVRWG